jgi:hypothetical protein
MTTQGVAFTDEISGEEIAAIVTGAHKPLSASRGPGQGCHRPFYEKIFYS